MLLKFLQTLIYILRELKFLNQTFSDLGKEVNMDSSYQSLENWHVCIGVRWRVLTWWSIAQEYLKTPIPATAEYTLIWKHRFYHINMNLIHSCPSTWFRVAFPEHHKLSLVDFNMFPMFFKYHIPNIDGRISV